jgi:hypothetical protein
MARKTGSSLRHDLLKTSRNTKISHQLVNEDLSLLIRQGAFTPAKSQHEAAILLIREDAGSRRV